MYGTYDITGEQSDYSTVQDTNDYYGWLNKYIFIVSFSLQQARFLFTMLHSTGTLSTRATSRLESCLEDQENTSTYNIFEFLDHFDVPKQ